MIAKTTFVAIIGFVALTTAAPTIKRDSIPCKAPGELVCVGTDRFELCPISGVVTTSRPVAPGTTCKDGRIVGVGIYSGQQIQPAAPNQPSAAAKSQQPSSPSPGPQQSPQAVPPPPAPPASQQSAPAASNTLALAPTATPTATVEPAPTVSQIPGQTDDGCQHFSPWSEQCGNMVSNAHPVSPEQSRAMQSDVAQQTAAAQA